MTDRNMAWAAWVKDHRKALRMTRREMAAQSLCDPSYVTLIERDGYVPRKDVAKRIAAVLKAETEGLVVAGFVPQGVSKPLVLASIQEGLVRTTMSPQARQLMLRLREMDLRDQDKAAAVLLATLEGLQRAKPKRLKAVSA